MKSLHVKMTRAFDGGPLAVLDLPGDGAELRPQQLRHLAAALLLGRRYNRAKKAHGGDRRSDESSGQVAHLKTAESLAAQHHVSFDDERRELLRAWSEFLAHSADVIRFEARAA